MTRLFAFALLALACGGNSIHENGDGPTGVGGSSLAGSPGYAGAGQAGAGGMQQRPDVSRDPCAELGNPTVPLWSQHVKKTFEVASAERVEHSLRVWFAAQNGFCDELYASDGADSVSVSLASGQTGSFAFPADNLCTSSGYPSGQLVIEPTATTFPAPRLTGAVTGICLRVYESSISADSERHVGVVDATWQILGH